MSEAVSIHWRFTPLFVRNGTRYKVITGGRGSMKSFSIAEALLCRTFDDDGTILFTRFTLVNAEVSILPEFEDKITRHGWQGVFRKSGNDYYNLATGGKILFRGIKTSSGINTAALKSIPKLKMWVNDESEELVDERVFDTIDDSIRYGEECEVWLALNPSDIHHFIYRRFFAANGVRQVGNGVRGNITYIHTTYLDNDHLPEDYRRKAEDCRESDAEKYRHIWLGEWQTLTEGLIYKGWTEDAAFPTDLDCWYGVDWGFANDPAAVVRVAYDGRTNTVWLKEILYETGMLTADVARAIRADIFGRERTFRAQDGKVYGCGPEGWTRDGQPWDIGTLRGKAMLSYAEKDLLDELTRWAAVRDNCYERIYCDPARPEQIHEMRVNHSLSAVPAQNRDKTGRIAYLQYFRIRYEGRHIGQEVENYRWMPSRTDATVYTNVPQDGNDHCFTADTMIETSEGPKRIIDIKVGDFVATSKGWKRVLYVWDNGCKKLRRCKLNFVNLQVEITATENHRFKTANGWKTLNELTAGDALYLLKPSTERHFICTKVLAITRGTRQKCTDTCGSSTTGLSRTDGTSTTKTTTRITMTSAILNSLKRASTKVCTLRKTGRTQNILNRRENEWLTPRRYQRNGTPAQRGENGIVNTRKASSATGIASCVRSAVLNTKAANRIQSTAATLAPQKRGEYLALTTKREYAFCAGGSMRQTDLKNKYYAAGLVLQSIDVVCEIWDNCYDLTIEDAHEYYANGVLVHNCMDAINYAAVSHLRSLGIAAE